MTSTNSILELRQADSNLVNANGDYEILLAKDTIINSGDILALKNAFIDTKPEGNIVIDSDTTLTIQFMPYITDWLLTEDKQEYYNRDNSEAEFTKTVNGLDFVPYYYTDSGVIEGYETITAVNYASYPPVSIPPPPPSFTTTYSYINAAGQTVVFHTTVFRAFEPGMEGTLVPDPLSGVVAKIGSFKLLTDPKLIASVFMDYAGSNPIVISPIPPESDIWNPYIFTTTLVIPQGNYSPSFLSLYISEKLSQNNSQNLPTINSLAQTPFLKTSKNYDVDQPMPNGALNPDGTPRVIGEEGTMYIATDNSLRFIFAEGKNYFIGSSQIALEYDTDSNKMVFQFLHFPMYDNVSGTNISVRYQYYNNVDTNPIIATAKNGGILLTGLSSVDATGNSTNFWTDVLGFDLGVICVNSHAGYLTTVLGLSGLTQTLGTTTHGVNMTTGFAGIDTIVVKNQSKFYLEEPLTSFDDNILSSTINNTIALEASTTINQLINRYSHYIIQTDIVFRNTFTGINSFTNMNGIISKWYSSNNYTFSDGDGAIEYIHSGQPVYIKSIKVRILSSDKTIDPELGSDNTIFFQIIKSSQIQKKN
jgi:hypothetical protein